MLDRIISAVRTWKKFSFMLVLALVLFLSIATDSCSCNGVGNCSCNGDGTCDGGLVPFAGQQTYNIVPAATSAATLTGIVKIQFAHFNVSGVLMSRD